MPCNSHVYRVSLLLVALSTALVQAVLADRAPAAGVAQLAVSVGVAVALGGAGRWLGRGGAVAGVVGLAALPIVWDALSRPLLGVGDPYEVQLAYVLRNAMLGLAATPRLPRATPLATLASFFLVVFSFLWSAGPVAIGLLVAYAIVGAWWLFAGYWDRLGGRFADSSESSMPIRPAAAAVGIFAIVALGGVPLARQSLTTSALAGFFPSSGGTQHSDPFANGGVGDGDQMVAAKDSASSFGPVESELFLESKMPSLYDAFNEMSEATTNKRKRLQRAIPLAPSQVKTNHKKRGLTQQATREFNTVRKSPERTPETEDRLSAALLLVKGRTPLHLALETFDRWDGRSLLASESAEPVGTSLRDPDIAGRRWLNLSISRPTDGFRGLGESQVRVVNLKTDRVPTPSGVRRVSLDGLHAASFFDFTADGCLAMDIEWIPQLTIFRFQSDMQRRDAEFRLASAAPEDDGSERVARLAREWTAGVPAGWRQVEAVVARLRRDFEHDRAAMVPEDADDAVEHFLFESRRGPDYLFAASAAVMLRSLGYDTRVRGGFYASPARYSRSAQMTPVLAEDAHFWVEVLTSNGVRRDASGVILRGVWVTVEPTPGYDVLYAPETLWERLARAITGAVGAVLARPATATMLVFVGGVLYATRRRVADGVLLAWWWAQSRTAGAGRLARLTLRLLEWRAWTHRCGRPVGTTLGNWEALRAHGDFVDLASWSLYGAGAPIPLDQQAAREACRRAIHTPMRRLPPPGARSESTRLKDLG